MRRVVLPLLFGTGLALLGFAFSTPAKEGLVAFFLGAAIVLSMLAAAAIRRLGGGAATDGRRPSDVGAIAGGLVGLLLGGFAGARSPLGSLLIATIARDLPERDFAAPLGAGVGGLLGAAFVAILASMLAPRRR